jgi:hypothetical protein
MTLDKPSLYSNWNSFQTQARPTPEAAAISLAHPFCGRWPM